VPDGPAGGVRLDDLAGLLHRSLHAFPDGRRDGTTAVTWLQGPGLYCDLRRPPGRPGFTGVRGSADLRPAHLEWMVRQQGFAGRCTQEGDVLRWERTVDLQPAGEPDEGRVRWEGGVLVEEGLHGQYLERWHPERVAGAAAAARLTDRGSGAAGVLVRVGDAFGHARARPRPLPPGTALEDLLRAAAHPDEQRALVDCEVCLGAVVAGRWVVRASSLPFREGADLAPRPDGDGLATADVGADGSPLTRRWALAELEGDPALLRPERPPAPAPGR
jgi:hypothetical protein